MDVAGFSVDSSTSDVVDGKSVDVGDERVDVGA